MGAKSKMPQLFLEIAEGKSPNRPLSPIFRIENHDQALSIWRDSGCVERILIHVDAHHDMWWVAPGQVVTIANFISPALHDGLIREVYWVVPDRSWESADNRRHILHHLYKIQGQFPGRPQPVEIRRDRISTKLLSKPLHICAVDGLPKFGEDVLLDLDVDYMVIPRVKYGSDDPRPALPWIWPEELLTRLHARGVQAQLVTIAYSVYGGYTPLRWKYFGDELEARLGGADTGILRGLQLMREGAEAAVRGECSAAELNFLEAAECLPSLAAPSWQLAYLYLAAGRLDEARRMYQNALRLDPSYFTPFNSDALSNYWERRWKAAESECRRTLQLNPEDASAHLVLAWLALQQSQWGTAESEARRAAEIQPDSLDAQRALGEALQKLGRRQEAVAAFEKSLKLALTGQQSLHECPAIAVQGPRLNDWRHFDVYQRIGELYLALGELDRADRYIRMAVAAGLDGVAPRFRLAAHAFRQKRWKAVAWELMQLGKQLVVRTRQNLWWLWRRVRRPFVDAYELWLCR
jgi:tetratricopeptide (TPR) repeat protein